MSGNADIQTGIQEQTGIDLAAGTWVEYVLGWMGATEADGLLARLREEPAWEQREIVLFGRRVLQPRLIAWAGSLGFRYSGQTLEPREPTPTTAALMARVSERTGVPFNHVLLNCYRDGSDRIGLHADNEPELGLNPIVARHAVARRNAAIRPEATAPRPRTEPLARAPPRKLARDGWRVSAALRPWRAAPVRRGRRAHQPHVPAAAPRALRARGRRFRPTGAIGRTTARTSAAPMFDGPVDLGSPSASRRGRTTRCPGRARPRRRSRDTHRQPRASSRNAPAPLRT